MNLLFDNEKDYPEQEGAEHLQAEVVLSISFDFSMRCAVDHSSEPAKDQLEAGTGKQTMQTLTIQLNS